MKLFSILQFTVFTSGVCTMMLELVGSRILAPYVGTSIYIWTSLIGIILASLSLGYWIGGRMADQKPHQQLLSLLLAISALCVGMTASFNPIVLSTLSSLISNIQIVTLLSTIILFSPASILLGMVSPFAVRLSIQSVKSTGITVGNLSALSTLGSIIGTFLAGFYLIAIVGSTNLLYLIAGILLVAALLLDANYHMGTKVSVGLFLAYLAISNVFLIKNVYSKQLVDVDTSYNRVWIFESSLDGITPFKLMKINNENSSGQYYDSGELVFDYAKYYRLAEVFYPDFKKTLMIGGAAYTYPQYFLRTYPQAQIDVVEIDPGLTELARKHFGLKDDPRLRVIHEDGRIYLNKSAEKYDVIYGDAFKSFTVPFQLTTQQVVQRMNSALTDNGLVLVNIIGSIEGSAGEYIRAQYKTFKSVFPQVYLLTVSMPDNAYDVQNLMLVASKSVQPLPWSSSDPELQSYLNNRWGRPITDDMPVLTDDFAPVDYYSRDVASLASRAY